MEHAEDRDTVVRRKRVAVAWEDQKRRQMPAKHTPGPWTADTDTDSEGNFRAAIMDENLHAEIAIVTQDVSYDNDNGEPRILVKRAAAEANARLIAAAPDLLAACEYALRYTIANGDAHDRLRDAIAKAVSQ
jgi:hypothetical protein